MGCSSIEWEGGRAQHPKCPGCPTRTAGQEDGRLPQEGLRHPAAHCCINVWHPSDSAGKGAAAFQRGWIQVKRGLGPEWKARGDPGPTGSHFLKSSAFPVTRGLHSPVLLVWRQPAGRPRASKLQGYCQEIRQPCRASGWWQLGHRSPSGKRLGQVLLLRGQVLFRWVRVGVSRKELASKAVTGYKTGRCLRNHAFC